jgi:hypothetical protein
VTSQCEGVCLSVRRTEPGIHLVDDRSKDRNATDSARVRNKRCRNLSRRQWVSLEEFTILRKKSPLTVLFKFSAYRVTKEKTIPAWAMPSFKEDIHRSTSRLPYVPRPCDSSLIT